MKLATGVKFINLALANQSPPKSYIRHITVSTVLTQEAIPEEGRR